MAQLAVFDWVLLAACGLSVALGVWRGMVAELLAIAGWVAAFIAAPIHAQTASQTLLPATWPELLRLAGGYILVFVAVLLAASLLAWAAKLLLKAVGLRPIDRLLGAAFGLLRFVLLALVLGLLGHLLGIDQKPFWQQSISGPTLSATTPIFKATLPQAIAKHL
jgi:membrane protein required for colicin V production